MLLLRVISALNGLKVPYALVGGYAVSLHGAVRGTLDIDLVLPLAEKYFVAAEKALHSLGLEARIPVQAKEVFAFRREYIEERNLVAWSFVNPANPGELVDIIITHDLSDFSLKTFKVQGSSVKVVSISDLIKMKQQSGREQDIADISALEKLL